jgi:aspartate aminotransferase-like enzyme
MDTPDQKYAGTPPEHLLFGLRQALDLLFAEGIGNAFRRHQLLAEAVRRAVGVWAEGGAIEFNIIAPRERCDTVTAVLMNRYDPELLRAYCNEQCGVVLGSGIGQLSGRAFRIAHMGHVNAPMILGTLGVIEMGLAALGIPHGSRRRLNGLRSRSLLTRHADVCRPRAPAGEVVWRRAGRTETQRHCNSGATPTGGPPELCRRSQ